MTGPAPTARESRRPGRADHYRRQARRLRATLGGRPGRLHRKLRELADRHDALGSGEVAAEVYDSPGNPVPRRRAAGFAGEVADRMDGPVLRHSQRRALLAIAERAGLGRFEANLIIAAVQHRRLAEVAAPPSHPDTARAAVSLAPMLVVLAVESVILIGVWRVCFG